MSQYIIIITYYNVQFYVLDTLQVNASIAAAVVGTVLFLPRTAGNIAIFSFQFLARQLLWVV